MLMNNKNSATGVTDLQSRISELERREEDCKKAERELLRVRQFFSGIVQIAEDAIISLDHEQRIRVFNRGAEKIFGYHAHEVLGQPLDLLLPSHLRQVHRTHVSNFAKSESQARWMGERQEIVGLRKDGAVFPAEASISKLAFDDGSIAFTVILRDISERRKQEDELRRSREELRRLAARLDSIREEESKRIAREIHDELGQSLTVIKLGLSGLAVQLENPEQKRKTEELAESVGTTMQTVRRIARDLRPSMLDGFGLQAAMESHLEDFQKHTGIECELQIKELEHPPEQERAVALFRIFQEALTNIARHANASKATITLDEPESNPGVVRLQVTDNGRGFDILARGKQSLGLVGMRERALNIGGDLSIESQPGQGTAIRVCIPH